MKKVNSAVLKLEPSLQRQARKGNLVIICFDFLKTNKKISTSREEIVLFK